LLTILQAALSDSFTGAPSDEALGRKSAQAHADNAGLMAE